MVLMIAAVLFSAVLTLLFKLFSRWRVHTFHAIVINYFTAVFCGVLFSGQLPFSFGFDEPKAFLALIIGCFFILGFNVLAWTVQVYGITIGTLMQKMSVLLTVIYALTYFQEPLGVQKMTGILLAVISIGMVTFKRSGAKEEAPTGLKNKLLYLPLLTFITSGFIDSLFLTGQKFQWVTGTDITFIGSLFFTAGSIGLLILLFVPSVRSVPDRRTTLAGLLLGVPNFFSIYFLLKILDQGWEGSVVFPVFNVGVLLASAMMGWLLLKEDMPVRRLAGVIMAAISIYLISAAV